MLRLATSAGVFSGDRIDPGTQVLLDLAGAPPCAGDLLDLGCGYGPIALSLALRFPDRAVWAVDVNSAAVELTRRNAAAAGLESITASTPECLSEAIRFAAIYTNPPIRIGKAALHALLLTWMARLTPGGVAYMVISRHLGADSLCRWLGEEGFLVQRLGSRRGYRVISVSLSR